MQGSIDQALTLTVAGNAFLQGWDIGPFWPEAKTFVFCNKVQFAAAEGLVAADPNDWLRQLRSDGARLRLAVLPRHQPGISDRDAVAFANGGPRWLIEAERPGGISAWWEPEWRIAGDPHRVPHERQPWAVTYWRRDEALTPAEPRPFSAIVAGLGETLDALVRLVARAAPEEAMPGWEENFRRARTVLDEDEGKHGRGDPGPEGFLSVEACRLLHACRAAWVFGGMGAWNDGAYWGSVEAEGDRLSEILFDLIQQGIVAVAGSTAA